MVSKTSDIFGTSLHHPHIDEAIEVCLNSFEIICIMRRAMCIESSKSENKLRSSKHIFERWELTNREILPKVNKSVVKKCKYRRMLNAHARRRAIAKKIRAFYLLQSIGTGFCIQIWFFFSSRICTPFHRHRDTNTFSAHPIFNLIPKSNYGFVCIFDSN